jgi:hypothetical protein
MIFEDKYRKSTFIVKNHPSFAEKIRECHDSQRRKIESDVIISTDISE